MKRRARPWLMASTLIVIAGVTGGLSQPGEDAPPPTPTEPAPLVDPGVFRERLERRMEELDRQRERMQRAMARLEAGEAPSRVMRELLGPGMAREGGFGRDAGNGRGPGGDAQPVRPFRDRFNGPGPNGGPPGGDFPGAGLPLSGEERERALGIIQERLPSIHERLTRLRELDPVAAERMLDRLTPRLREAFNAMRRDPEQFELRARELESGLAVFDASMALRRLFAAGEMAGERVDAARGALREALGAQHDARLALQQHQIASLEKELARVRAEFDDAGARREQILDERTEAFMEGMKARAGEGGPGPR